MSVPEPSKILTPWATSGLKNAIPATANPVTGNAGYDQGFPAINMTPKEAGGIPPFGQDFNGALFEITTALRYIQAGGTPTYSAALSTAIGGYPKGAILLGDDGVTTYRSLVDSNTNNPNSVLTGWAKNDSDRFGVSFADNGYQKLPSGLIIQWVSVTTPTVSNGATPFSWPIAFPNATLSAALAANFAAAQTVTPYLTVTNRIATGATLSNAGGAISAGAVTNTTIIAIGH